jgi:ribosomal protein S12 methylthiotransferase
MGCSKYLVDSEQLMKRLESLGYEAHHDSDNVRGEIVVVNTCGFIGDAKEESINMILQLLEAKGEGQIGKLYVMGCLSERYLSDLKSELPDVDGFYGKFDWNKIVDALEAEKQQKCSALNWERKLTTPPYSAYIKISEGCNRFCAYCAIPLITGRHKSRPIDEIESEVKALVAEGVKEFNIIAQDLSAYGSDLYGKLMLPELIEKIAQIEGVEWVRLHYAYPVDFPWEVLEVMKRYDNVCNYLDIALQHIADPVLTNMRRHITKEETLKVIEKIRNIVPDIKLRTTLMVGFPGETEEAFKELVDFVREVKFDRMGAFTYSAEENTPSFKLNDDVSQEEKDERLDELTQMQEGISLQLNRNKIGKVFTVLIDRKEGEYWIGRTEHDSPEVDNEVLIPIEEKAKIGEFFQVKITDAIEFDLYGEIIEK